jgi:hypothetical protein
MPRKSQSASGGCGFGCLGLLILFAMVGRGCGASPPAYEPSSGYAGGSYSSQSTVAGGDESFTTLYAHAPLNVRAGPGTRYRVVRTLARGESIGVGVADGRGWAPVQGSYAGEYVFRDSPSLRSTRPASHTPSTASRRPRRTRSEEVSPTGATAMCRDGSLSYSAHRRGTCSHHGGVAVWY